jgi:hypothetical protein
MGNPQSNPAGNLLGPASRVSYPLTLGTTTHRVKD